MDITDSLWSRSLLRPFLIATLVTALLTGPLAIGQVIAPQLLPDRQVLQTGYVLPLLFLVAIEAVYTTTWLAHPRRRLQRTPGFRLAELVVWLVLVRLLLWVLRGHWPDLYDLWRWLRAPGLFFDPEFVFVSLLVTLAWAEGISNGVIFQQLALQPDELSEPPDRYRISDWRASLGYGTSRTAIMARFAQRWVWGGAILALCAALSRLEFRPGAGWRMFGLAHLDLSPLMLTALVVYFLSGLLLMSVGRLAILRARWRTEHIEGERAVVHRWPRFTLLLLLLVGVLAALLPLGSTWRLGTWLQVAVFFVSNLLYTLLFYSLALFSRLLDWLFSALGLGGEPMRQERLLLEPPQPFAPFPEARIRLPEWLGGTFFWSLMAVIVTYALLVFLQGRGMRLEWGRLHLLWLRLRAWYRRWRRGVQEAVQGMRGTLAQRLAQRGVAKMAQAAWGFLPWRGLSPPERVRLFYLFTLRRAREQGVPRRPQQTPYEFAPALKAGWPEIEEELGTLTQAFVEARYSARAIAPDEVQTVQQVWRRVRNVLRRRGPATQAKSE
ncbi:MAG: DUF4129 domain-containing protein [Anaerolineae bacterium]|nr:DUF4129 domain-containing protein [Anaerolineae bacterium]